MGDVIRRASPYLGTALRLVVGAVWIIAAVAKLPDPEGSVRAVRAYKVVPNGLAVYVGHGLPLLEVSIGVLLVLGAATRIASLVSAVLLVIFIAGISQAWARGLQIQCGCFGGGGYAANASQHYPIDIARDVALLAASVWLVIRDKTFVSMDQVLVPAPEPVELGKPGTKAYRSRVLRAESAERERVKRANTVGGIVLAGIVAVLMVGIAAYAGTTVSTAGRTPAHVTAKGGVYRGKASAPVQIVVYEDFQCPVCRAYEQLVGPMLLQKVDSGEVRMEYRPIAFLDRSSTTNYSSRALETAACVVDEDGDAVFDKLHDLLYKNQPEEGSAGLTDATLAGLAAQAGASESKVEACQAAGTFDKWTAYVTDQSSKDGITGTPTYFIDGKRLNFTNNENPKTTLENAIAAADQ